MLTLTTVDSNRSTIKTDDSPSRSVIGGEKSQHDSGFEQQEYKITLTFQLVWNQ